jgi:hypothetical protein
MLSEARGTFSAFIGTVSIFSTDPLILAVPAIRPPSLSILANMSPCTHPLPPLQPISRSITIIYPSGNIQTLYANISHLHVIREMKIHGHPSNFNTTPGERKLKTVAKAPSKKVRKFNADGNVASNIHIELTMQGMSRCWMEQEEEKKARYSHLGEEDMSAGLFLGGSSFRFSLTVGNNS